MRTINGSAGLLFIHGTKEEAAEVVGRSSFDGACICSQIDVVRQLHKWPIIESLRLMNNQLVDDGRRMRVCIYSRRRSFDAGEGGGRSVGRVGATEKVAGAKRKRQLDDEKKSCRASQHNKPAVQVYTYTIDERERRAATSAFWHLYRASNCPPAVQLNYPVLL